MKSFDEVIGLLQKLVSIQSPYFEEDAVMDFAANWLRQNGLSPTFHTFHEDKVTGFSGRNILCTVDSGRPGPTIFLNGHLDTVKLCSDWTRDPYAGTIEGDRLYGLGALDMKSGCAALMVALKAFAADDVPFKGKVILALVSDEEGPYGLGTNAILEDGLLPPVDVSIVAEPSAGFVGLPFPSICLGARGGYGLIVELFGKAAHAANPHMGVSAAVDMAKVVCELENIEYQVDDKLAKGDSCVIRMEADGGACSVPDYARFDVFRHIVRGEDRDTILGEVEAAIARANITCQHRVRIREAPSEGSAGFMPYTVPEDDPWVTTLCEVIKDTTGKDASFSYFQSIGDFNYLGTRLGAPCLIFGTEGEHYHGPDEYTTISSLTATTRVLYNTLVRTLRAD